MLKNAELVAQGKLIGVAATAALAELACAKDCVDKQRSFVEDDNQHSPEMLDDYTPTSPSYSPTPTTPSYSPVPSSYSVSPALQYEGQHAFGLGSLARNATGGSALVGTEKNTQYDGVMNPDIVNNQIDEQMAQVIHAVVGDIFSGDQSFSGICERSATLPRKLRIGQIDSCRECGADIP